MKMSLPPNVSSFLENLKRQAQRHSILAPILALALARYVYHKRQGHLDQLRLHRALSRQLTDEFDYSQFEEGTSSPIAAPAEEWNIVADDGTQAQSLVYYPMETTENDNVLVLVIPGNPGVPFYYLPLMQEIVKKHGRRHEVRCLSHAGHFMPWKNNGRAFTLQEQLEHKAFYLKQRLLEDPTLKLVLIGHSIGSYFVLDIARRFPQQIAKLVLMQPTIMHMAQSPKGKQMMPLFKNYERGVTLVEAVEYLVPPSLRRWIVRRVVGSKTSETLQLASLSLVNSSVMRNVLGMAANEMKDVTELDHGLMKSFEDKTLFVYSTVDEWVPAEFVQEYQIRFSNALHRVVPQAHAFMMETNGTRDMAAHITQWVGDVLDGKEMREIDAIGA
ncbi:Lipid droplet-associated hydrolase [Phytophthora citrophthora]|uniref:Lipid droplet-associated hydrolase n=1 Tax=Phytophthora citrophthora TaxID=4793 RepID=A0AAD9LBI6_9STRA|nr:Lipid droplet-associated hydrolase [Phytophthora citrophthora]